MCSRFGWVRAVASRSRRSSFAFHAARIGTRDRGGQGGQVVDEFVDVLGAHPGCGAGQPVAQFPFAVAFAAAPAADLDGDPAADLGDGLVRQLHEVEVVDDELGVRQRGADRGLEDRAHVDGHVSDLRPPLRPAGACSQSMTTWALRPSTCPSRPCPCGQVAEADVPPVDRGLPPAVGDPRIQCGRPRRISSMPSTVTGSGLVRQHRRGMDGERGRHHRPGHAVITRGLHDACGRRQRPPHRRRPATGRSTVCAAGTAGTASVNDRRAHPRLVTVPAALAPDQPRPAPTDRKIPRPGHRPALRPDRPHTTPRTASGLLIGGDQVHDRDTYFLIDPRRRPGLQGPAAGTYR